MYNLRKDNKSEKMNKGNSSKIQKNNIATNMQNLSELLNTPTHKNLVDLHHHHVPVDSPFKLINCMDKRLEKFAEQIQRTIDVKFQEFKEDLLNNLSEKYRVLENEILGLKERVTILENAAVEINSMRQELHNRVSELRSDVVSLKTKSLNQENSLVASDVRITGIPSQNNENLNEIFENICRTLNFPLPSKISAFRIRKFKDQHDNFDLPIIIKFSTPYEKNYFLRIVAEHRRKYKSPLRLSDAGFQSEKTFYIHENLTPHNYGIFKKAVGLKRDKLIKTAYTLRGIVYVKHKENDDPISILYPEQLEQFFRSTN